jgi:hypothetical protein
LTILGFCLASTLSAVDASKRMWLVVSASLALLVVRRSFSKTVVPSILFPLIHSSAIFSKW